MSEPFSFSRRRISSLAAGAVAAAAVVVEHVAEEVEAALAGAGMEVAAECRVLLHPWAVRRQWAEEVWGRDPARAIAARGQVPALAHGQVPGLARGQVPGRARRRDLGLAQEGPGDRERAPVEQPARAPEQVLALGAARRLVN